MENAIIVLSIGVTLTFLLVGVLLGWTVKQYLDQTRVPFMHPEMFDGDGNVIPDEILSVRFENDLISEDEDIE